jgi:hypothetical protein
LSSLVASDESSGEDHPQIFLARENKKNKIK